MAPELESLLRQVEAVKADGQALCAGLTESQFNWRPASKRWSIAECLAHLNTGVTAVLPAFDRAIGEGRARGRVAAGEEPVRYGWFSRWMIAEMEPPPKRRLKTLPVFDIPAGATYAMSRVLPEFLAVRDQLADRVRRADGLDLKRIRVISPASRFIRLPLGAYFQFIVAHDRRHLWQGRQVRNAPGFGLDARSLSASC